MRRAASLFGLVVWLAACGAETQPAPAPLVPAGMASVPPSPRQSAAATPQHVVVTRNPDSRIASFRIAFLAGSADDPVDRPGLTRLLATTMAEGGTEQHTYRELVDALFPMAAEIRTHVDRDETVFEAEVPNDRLEPFYALLKEVLLTPRLDAEGLERLRARAKSELADDLRGGNDEELGKEALSSMVYEGHPYGHPALGTDRGLAAATLEDLRSHRARVFCRDRVLAGVAGGVPEGFGERLTHDLGALPACTAPRAPLPDPVKLAGLHVLVVDKPTAESTAISMGASTAMTRASSDYPAIAFFMDYLGLHRSDSALLYEELRTRRGLNYGDYAYAEFFEQQGDGAFTRPNLVRRQQLVSIWIRPVKPQNTLFALRGALYFYSHLLANGVPDAEITRARSFLSRYLALGQLTESLRLGYAMDDLAYGLNVPYLTRLRDAWKTLDHDSLDEATDRELSADNLTIAIVSKNGTAIADALGRGDPTPPVYDAPKPPDVVAQDQAIARYPMWIKRENVRVVNVSEMFH